MIHFHCDYQEGCAPEILARLQATNMEQTIGYGQDPYSQEAKALIAKLCGIDTQQGERLWREKDTAGSVHLLVGGTQTNTLVINALLRPHQGVIAADSGHINVHETGAIEHCGHKVMAQATTDGKLTAAQVQDVILSHLYDPNIEHMVQPGMVYISFPTETGMLYTKQELTALSAICRQYELPLYIDGARLGYGLMAPAADITLRELAALADVMYIGGTKQGALFGEALVVCNPKYRKDLRYLIKQSGGMLAKGRLIGIQFLTLMQNDLYWQLAAKAVRQALSIRQALLDKGYRMASESPTNQQFVIIADNKLNELKTRYLFDYCERVDEAHSMVRICTSWATRDEDVNQLIHDL